VLAILFWCTRRGDRHSLRSNRKSATSLIDWPTQVVFSNYRAGWNKFCMAENCWGMSPSCSFLT